MSKYTLNNSVYFKYLVRERGLEPPQPCGHYDLNVARLPFRHSRRRLPHSTQFKQKIKQLP